MGRAGREAVRRQDGAPGSTTARGPTARRERLTNNILLIPYSREFRKWHDDIRIQLPPCLAGKRVKEIRIIPIV